MSLPGEQAYPESASGFGDTLVKLKPMLAALACALVLSVACSGNDGSTKSTAVPPTIPPATPVAGSTPMVDGEVITSATAARLRPVNRASIEQPQGMVWRADSSAVLVYTDQTISELNGVADSPLNHVVATLPEGERIVAVSAKSEGAFLTLAGEVEVNLRSLQSSQVLNTIDIGSPVSTALFAPNGSQAAIQRLDEIAVDLVSLPDGGKIKELSGFETAAPVYSIQFSEDGRSLIWRARASVQVMDFESSALGAKIDRQDPIAGVALAPNSDGLTLATVEGSYLHLFDAQTGREHAVIPLPAPASAVVYSPAGQLLAVATTAGVQLFDLASMRLAMLPGDIREVSFSPDGTAIATFDESGEVVIWKVPA
jgi:WD40 repeat protein